jgi:hypothetical protein
VSLFADASRTRRRDKTVASVARTACIRVRLVANACIPIALPWVNDGLILDNCLTFADHGLGSAPR